MDIFEDFAPLGQGAVLEVLHPTTGLPLVMDGETPVTITLVGKDSEQFRAAVRERTNKNLKAMEKASPTAEMVEQANIDLLAACTLGWSGIQVKDQPWPFTPDNARYLYTRLVWLRDQVDGFIADRANFLKASAAK